MRLTLDIECLAEDWGQPLGASSKQYRDRRLRDLLIAHGCGQARAFHVVRNFFLDGWKSAKSLDSGLAKQVRRLSRTFHFRSQPSTEDVRFRRLEKEGADAWHVEADWF